MANIFTNHSCKEVLIVPFKTASSYVKQHLANNADWQYTSVWDYTLGCSRFPNTAIWLWLQRQNLSKYRITLVGRDPLEWLISSYKYINYVENGGDQNRVFEFNEHLETMIKGDYPSNNWQYHACVFPQDYYTPNQTHYIEIDNLVKLKWFRHSQEKINSSENYPDPKISKEELEIIEHVTRPRYQYLNYGFEDSLKRWQLRQDSNLQPLASVASALSN